MGAKTYTIGDLARLSGQPVRRIRFYSDKGLLPPTLRSASNYRVYTDADIAKLDLIHALREAGVGLDTIGGLVARRPIPRASGRPGQELSHGRRPHGLALAEEALKGLQPAR